MPATYDPDRERRRQQADRDKAMRAAERDRKAAEAREKAAYVAARKNEALRTNAGLEQRVQLLSTFLVSGLSATENPDLSSQRRIARPRPLHLGDIGIPLPEPAWDDFAPEPPGFWRRTFSPAAVAYEEGQARLAFEAAQHEHQSQESARRNEVERRKQQHEVAVRRTHNLAERANAELDDLIARKGDRDKPAVEEYSLRILSLIPRPEDFPTNAQATFDPRSENLVVEVELPTPECIPATKSVKYVQARDEIVRAERPRRELSELYRSVVAQLCLLAVRALFNADVNLKQISMNGRVSHVNPATGREEHPHILSVLVERPRFESLVLDRVQPGECLKYLKALISPHPYELEAVEPLVDFDKSRLAFVEGLKMVSHLDSRPDLMALSPTEFEHLIRELFDADPTIDSVESLVTRQSNDGGIDGVIYVKQPLGRSMTAVQVKQYARSRALGPAHVRELIGAMHEAKAGNGLLVTTSSFTATATTNAKEFGRIMLIDGNNLVHLIKEHLGKEVLIGDRSRSK